MAKEREFDIVVFGATGFTGGLAADYLAAIAASGAPLRWAIAGRDPQKLAQVAARLRNRGTEPAIIVANASDARAVGAMAERTRVVLTTVGPYIHHGEPLVRACADAGTHYVDLTGEAPFVDTMRARYHDKAVARRAKIVHACGFDSIPHDLGAYFTLQALRRRLSESERATLPITIEGVVRMRGTFSGGTWHTALEIMSRIRDGEGPPRTAPEGRAVHGLPKRTRYRRELGLWTVPMPTIDPLIVLESARRLSEYGPDFRYGHNLGIKHLGQVSAVMAGVGTVAMLAQFAPTRALLAKLKASGDGPDEATREKSWFRVIFLGQAGPHHVRCEVRGGDPGYGETAKMIAESALALVRDEAILPTSFGVIPTAVAFGNVLIERLVRAGIQFEELPSKDMRARASPSADVAAKAAG